MSRLEQQQMIQRSAAMSRLEQQQPAGCDSERILPEPAMARLRASDRCRLPESGLPMRSRQPPAVRRSTSRAARGPNWPPPLPPRSDWRPGPIPYHAPSQTQL